MPEEHSLEGVPPRQDSNGRSGRPEFVQFRNRIQRLVESLVGLRNSFPAAQDWREQERVEVKLESAAVIVEFFIAQLSWEIANELAHHFQSSFAQFAPVFLNAPGPRIFKLGKSREKEGSYRQLHILEDTALTLQWDPLIPDIRQWRFRKITNHKSPITDHKFGDRANPLYCHL